MESNRPDVNLTQWGGMEATDTIGERKEIAGKNIKECLLTTGVTVTKGIQKGLG